MRIDRRLSRDVLTERQLYFIECWSNFCHKNSPDTDRVGYSNPLSTIRELLFLYEMEDRFSADKKRLRVATELLELLETDQVLKREAFEDIPAQLVTLLGSPQNSEKSYAKVFRASVRAETSRLPVCGSAARRNRRLG